LDTTDGDIITKVLAGDRDRFHVLVQRHAAPLWGTVRASLSNLDDAHEVFQETWLRAFQRLETLREPERLRAWLATIALNLVRQHLRKRVVPAESIEILEAEPSGEESTEEYVARAEEILLLRTRVAELPPRQREVVDLRLNHELSHAEIAELLDIREDASRASYYQALRRLKAGFAEDDPEEGTKGTR
jgi:RNA polymerase sigma-70 factor (ECF subfamily)